jgi:hypothetical protein
VDFCATHELVYHRRTFVQRAACRDDWMFDVDGGIASFVLVVVSLFLCLFLCIFLCFLLFFLHPLRYLYVHLSTSSLTNSYNRVVTMHEVTSYEKRFFHLISKTGKFDVETLLPFLNPPYTRSLIARLPLDDLFASFIDAKVSAMPWMKTKMGE